MDKTDDYCYEDDDHYVYSDTGVLVNLFNIKSPDILSKIERALSGVRYAELEENPIKGGFDLQHLCDIHKHLFGDIYPWAGKVRESSFIAKGNSLFCAPEFIFSYSRSLFGQLESENYLTGLNRPAFIKRLAFYIAEINALHPFREGNGRTQRAFVNQLARSSGWELNFSEIDPDELREAYIESMHVSTDHLERLLQEHVTAL